MTTIFTLQAYESWAIVPCQIGKMWKSSTLLDLYISLTDARQLRRNRMSIGSII
jgi:hypothetical protein